MQRKRTEGEEVDEQAEKILDHITDAQQKLRENEKSNIEAIREQNKLLDNEERCEKQVNSIAAVDADSNKMQVVMDLFQTDILAKTKRITDIEDQKDKQTKDFQAQIVGIQEDFNRIAEQAGTQSEYMQKQVQTLTEDLEHAQAAVNVQDAGQELMAKREMDAYRGKIGSDLQKAKVKIERLERELANSTESGSDFKEEMEQLRQQCAEYEALNTKLQEKVNKFSESAGKAADMKDQILELTAAYKEIS